MKYLAILKDSLREALDSKVLYVMLGLSLLVILLVGTTSFVPMEVEEDLQTMTQELNGFVADQLRGGGRHPGQFQQWAPPPPPMHFGIQDFRQTDADREPWLRDYRFTLTLKVSDQEFGEKVSARVIRDVLEMMFGMVRQVRFKDLKVVREAGQDPTSVRFRVTTGGTKVSSRRGWPHYMWLFGAIKIPAPLPLGFEIYMVEGFIVNGIGAWVTLIVGVIITAFFVPNMLRKGTIDLLLVKPVHRTTLLLLKYIGGLTFMFLCSVVAIGGVWVALGLRTGIWDAGFLLVIPVLTFFFAILYAVSTLFAVLTRSTVVAIMVTLGMWFLFFIVGQIYTVIHVPRNEPNIPGWVYAVVDTVHFVLPRTTDLNALTGKMLILQALPEELTPELSAALDSMAQFNWAEAVGGSLGFIAVMLGLACWRFATRDY
ncbi:MAG: ABC transporter permease subunit [Gemmataceae bacterium]|nr:ABC transporter permease subunit [Gemmataceae bacterium]